MTEANKNWDTSLVGFFENESKYGSFYNSRQLDEETIDKIVDTLRAGGKLKFRLVSEDKRKKIAAYLDFVSPEKVASFAKRDNDEV